MKSILRKSLSSLGLLLVIAVPQTAYSNAMQALTLQNLQQRASLIVKGQVIKQRSYWKGKVIYTASQVRVQSCWKKQCQSKLVTVRQFGGSVKDIVMRASGVTHLKVSSKVLLFLNRKTGQPSYHIVGMSQGIFRFVTHNQKEWLVQDRSKLLLASNCTKHKHKNKQIHRKIERGRLRIFAPQTILQKLSVKQPQAPAPTSPLR